MMIFEELVFVVPWLALDEASCLGPLTRCSSVFSRREAMPSDLTRMPFEAEGQLGCGEGGNTTGVHIQVGQLAF